MDLMYNIVITLAGLGALLFGIRQMTSGLEGALGLGFKRKLAAVASNPIKISALGAGTTLAVQSTTLMTSMTLGFLNVGSISLTQSLNLVIGINIGAGVSMLLLLLQSIDIIQMFALLCVVGVFMSIFVKKPTLQKIAQAITGFGLLCLGITLMGSGTREIIALPAVFDFVSTISNPLLLFLIGIIMVTITDSVFATSTICAALVGSMALPGPLGIESAMFLIYGAFLGSSFTSVLYNLNNATTADAKRSLWYVILCRVFAVILFFLISISPLATWLYNLVGGEAMTVIIIEFILISVIPGLILMPLSPLVSKLLNKIVRDRKKDGSIYDDFVLSDSTMQVYSVAYSWIENSVMKIIKMEMELCEKLVMRISDKNFDEKGLKGKLKALDKVIKLTTNNIIRLSSNQNEKEVSRLNVMMGIVNDAALLWKACEEIYEHGTTYKEKPRTMSASEAQATFPMWMELRELGDSVYALLSNADMEQRPRNKLIHDMFEISKRNSLHNTSARRKLFREYTKAGKYMENSLYFNIVMNFENINTDLTNIAIKAGMLYK